MTSSTSGSVRATEQSEQNLLYVRQMLGQLRAVARTEKADLLCYLIEMAFVEAGDLQVARRNASSPGVEGDEPAGVTMEPTGKIKF